MHAGGMRSETLKLVLDECDHSSQFSNNLPLLSDHLLSNVQIVRVFCRALMEREGALLHQFDLPFGIRNQRAIVIGSRLQPFLSREFHARPLQSSP